MRAVHRIRKSAPLMALVAGVATLGLVAAACSSGGGYSSTPTTPAAAATNAGAASQPVKLVTDAKYGEVLETASGMPLYTYNKDTAGKSNCTGGCLSEWPALAASGSAAPAVVGATGTFSLITRGDGTMQVAYNGLPLYTFVDDKPGQVTGDGQDGFAVAKVSAASAPASPTAASASTGSYTNY